jgi:hypothetical protein
MVTRFNISRRQVLEIKMSWITKNRHRLSWLIFGFLPPVYISPDQFLHKFSGTVAIEELRPWPGVLSVAEISPGLCRISITPKAVIGEKVYECLYLVELANCNGAFDVNADARRRSIPTGYERTCESSDWSGIYHQLINATIGR